MEKFIIEKGVPHPTYAGGPKTLLMSMAEGDSFVTKNRGDTYTFRETARRMGFKISVRCEDRTMGTYRLWLISRAPKEN